jgi:hypothetical protein
VWGSGSNYIATTSGTSLVSENTTPTLLTPMLQAQDGTFYGIDTGSGKHGQVRSVRERAVERAWMQPQIATADDGVIATPTSNSTLSSLNGPGPSISFDSNGNATGTVPDLVQSWIGEASYQDQGALLQSVVLVKTQLTKSCWGIEQ